MYTASAFHTLGKSTNGWSNIGLGLAESFKFVDYTMGNLSVGFTNSLSEIITLGESIDSMINNTGNAADASLLQHTHAGRSLLSRTKVMGDPASASSKSETLDLAKHLPEEMAALDTGFTKMIDLMEPALLQVGEWYESFGEKLQASLTQFSTTVDLVQKMFDQIMGQINGPGDNIEYMLHNTYTLFAISSSGTAEGDESGITVKDLSDVAAIYEITALQGSKSEELFTKYDANSDAVLDLNEFKQFVHDGAIPGAMAMVLRQYAKKLSQAAGQVKSARLRDETANAVVRYLQLVAAKNLTKVGWISNALTNESLPLPFTADIMKNLAQAADDPDVLTSSDIGSTVISAMASLNPEQTKKAAKLLADTDFWAAEGFDPNDQPGVVEKVTRWTSASFLQTGELVHLSELRSTLGGAPLGVPVHVPGRGEEKLSLLQSADGMKLVEQTASLGRQFAEHNLAAYHQRVHLAALSRYDSLHQSRSAKMLFDALLGGAMASTPDPTALAAVNSGVPATPATLLFASYLAANASQTAQEFQSACFNYSGISSSALDSFATQIEGMVKKVQGFLNMLEKYSGEKGVTLLRNQVKDFVENAPKEIEAILNNNTNQTDSGNTTGTALVQISQPAGGGSFDAMTTTLHSLQSVLPPVLSNLKFAKEEVSRLSSTLDSVFDVFKHSGLPVFNKISSLYKKIWIAYFVLLSLFTLAILYYAFWASGFFGGPKKHEDEESHPEPKSWREKCAVCWRSCTTCMRNTSETDCFFWSVLLLLELLVLVIFLISVVLCLLAGVKAFVASGCSSIYVLGDELICTQTLMLVQSWLTTFNAGQPDVDINKVCTASDLMVCDLISSKMKTSTILTTVFSLLAAIISFQLLVESAVLHERARMRRLIDQLGYDLDSQAGPAAEPPATPSSST